MLQYLFYRMRDGEGSEVVGWFSIVLGIICAVIEKKIQRPT
jgi:hypothetical protein